MGKKVEHTPGPWDYFVGNANGRGLIRIEAGNDSEEAGLHIASMPRNATSEANARLIAAAPDLLEALKDARYILYGDGPGNLKIDAAIAKAEATP